MKNNMLTQNHEFITVIRKSYISFEEKNELVINTASVNNKNIKFRFNILRLKLYIIIWPNHTDKLLFNQ
jgi:hypothetical protein